VPHVTLLLVWIHQKDDVALKINIILTLMERSCPASMVVAFKVASIVISKFLEWTIMVITSAKSFFPQKFSLILTRIQRDQESLMWFAL
jgi:hypothetical protein